MQIAASKTWEEACPTVAVADNETRPTVTVADIEARPTPAIGSDVT